MYFSSSYILFTNTTYIQENQYFCTDKHTCGTYLLVLLVSISNDRFFEQVLKSNEDPRHEENLRWEGIRKRCTQYFGCHISAWENNLLCTESRKIRFCGFSKFYNTLSFDTFPMKPFVWNITSATVKMATSTNTYLQEARYLQERTHGMAAWANRFGCRSVVVVVFALLICAVGALCRVSLWCSSSSKHHYTLPHVALPDSSHSSGMMEKKIHYSKIYYANEGFLLYHHSLFFISKWEITFIFVYLIRFVASSCHVSFSLIFGVPSNLFLLHQTAVYAMLSFSNISLFSPSPIARFFVSFNFPFFFWHKRHALCVIELLCLWRIHSF